MKIIEKITLIIYSNLMLIASVIICMIIFRWLDVDIVLSLVKNLVMSEVASKIILGVSLVFILLSIRCIFFDPTSKQESKDKQGVLLANENGKLMISKETIESLVEAVTSEYKTAKEVSSRVELDKENNVNIFINLVVSADSIIKDLSVNLQEKIKRRVKETTDLEVKEVNIMIKKAVQEKQKPEKEQA
ncbi:MAG: alkaline shock response membrane anchor protein AmaP [Clostridia bacterium]|nr:alkaline shock response membrane anchor protein AmaP [Clostridia bacterium]